MLEKDYVYILETDVSDLDANGYLKPSAYPSLFAKLAEKHLNLLDLNVEKTMTYGLAWALVSISLDITAPVKGCIRLHATTWHSERRGPYFRRELVFQSDVGEILFQGSTFSVLLDIENRSVFRKKETPFYVKPPDPIFAVEASPTNKADYIFTPTDLRTVRNSYIDCLGHVNNTRYGEFAHDALSTEACKSMQYLSHLDMYFSSELRMGNTFLISKAGDPWDPIMEDGTKKRIAVRGVNGQTNKTAFDVVFTFQHPL